jgi:predicted CXXCH cytochrome family protein
MTRIRRYLSPTLIISSALLLASFILVSPAFADDGPQQPRLQESECLTCHSQPGLQVELANGEELPLTINTERLSGSVHERIGISCDSCHPDISGYPHPKLEYETRRELSRAFYLTCRTCHASNYIDSLDSIHADIAAAGQMESPICTDCHGAHYTQYPNEPRALISETCGQCHTEIFAAYKSSVHGSALIEQNNPDVPVCTDCHGVHNIQDPRTALFRTESPELCASCHADPVLMAKYGYNSDVYSLYSISWHGVDVGVYKANWPTIWHDSAVCTDCHGVHNILPPDNPASSVSPQNLLATCRKCHPDAGPNWTGAWTGHNEISLQRTPLVYYTNIFYSSFVPFMLLLAGGYVLLRIIRATVDRVRRNLP